MLLYVIRSCSNSNIVSERFPVIASHTKRVIFGLKVPLRYLPFLNSASIPFAQHALPVTPTNKQHFGAYCCVKTIYTLACPQNTLFTISIGSFSSWTERYKSMSINSCVQFKVTYVVANKNARRLPVSFFILKFRLLLPPECTNIGSTVFQRHNAS